MLVFYRGVPLVLVIRMRTVDQATCNANRLRFQGTLRQFGFETELSMKTLRSFLCRVAARIHKSDFEIVLALLCAHAAQTKPTRSTRVHRAQEGLILEIRNLIRTPLWRFEFLDTSAWCHGYLQARTPTGVDRSSNCQYMRQTIRGTRIPSAVGTSLNGKNNRQL